MLVITVREGVPFFVGDAKIYIGKSTRGKGFRVAIDAPREVIVSRAKPPEKKEADSCKT